MLKRIASGGIPAGAFLFALILAIVAGPSIGTVAFRAPQEQTPCDTPTKEWQRQFLFTKLGFLNAQRKTNPDKITFAFSALRPTTVDLTMNASKECETKTGKKVCIQVFSSDGPEGGITATADGLGKTVRKGDLVCGHYKAFIEASCAAGPIQQLVKHTYTRGPVTGTEKTDPDRTQETHVFDGEINQFSAGNSFVGLDAPARVIPPVKKAVDSAFTSIRKDDFLTFMSCDGEEVAVVIWNATYKVVYDGTTVTCDVSSSTPVIECVGGDGFAIANAIRIVAKMKKDTKHHETEPNNPKDNGKEKKK